MTEAEKRLEEFEPNGYDIDTVRFMDTDIMELSREHLVALVCLLGESQMEGAQIGRIELLKLQVKQLQEELAKYKPPPPNGELPPTQHAYQRGVSDCIRRLADHLSEVR